MTEVVLVHPWYPEGRTLSLIPLGLAQLSSTLKLAGFSVDCQDLNFQKEVRTTASTRFLGVSVWTSAFDAARRILEFGKKAGLFCVAGGPHAALDPQSLLDAGFDAVISGDGDFALPNMLTKVEQGKPHDKVTYGYVDDLDRIPFPDFSWTHKYPYKKSQVPIMTSRGCPFECIFCGRAMGRKYRARSPENVVEELQMHEYEYIAINDDEFTIKKRRVLRISELVRREKLRFRGVGIVNGTRVDTVDEGIVSALVRMGLTNVMYGLESADPRVLKTAKKGITPEQVDDAIRLTKRFGITPGIFMMIGLPDSTLGSDLKSMKWIVDRDVYSNWSLTFPLPNTELYDWVNSNGEWLVDPKNYSAWLCGPMFHTKDYSVTERLRALFLAHTHVQERGWDSPMDKVGRRVRGAHRNRKVARGVLRRLIRGRWA